MEELDKTGNYKPERDEKGRILPGNTGNPKGRPKGSLSFITRIKKILEEEPDKFEEICRYYINDKRMRDLLIKMVDGMPKQSIDHGLDDNVDEIEITIRKNKDEVETGNN